MEAATLRAFFSYLFFFVCLFFIAAFSVNKEQPIPLGIALSLGVMVSLLGITEFFSPQSTQYILQYFRTQESISAVDNINRAASIFFHRNIFGCFSALLAIGTLLRIIRRQYTGLPRQVWAVTCICAMGGAVASTSKNAIISLVVGIACITFGKVSRWPKVVLATLALTGLILFAIAVTSGPDYGTNRPTAEAEAIYAAKAPFSEVYFAVDKFSKGRLHLWKYWWNKRLHKARYLWKGIGVGQFRAMHWDSTINAHSTYAQFLFEGGVIGLFALMALMGFGARLAYVNDRLPLYITFLTTLSFDHFFDYSLLWSINVPWLLFL